jgi:hypothetical protein
MSAQHFKLAIEVTQSRSSSQFHMCNKERIEGFIVLPAKFNS